MRKLINTPTRRSDYVQLLIGAWQPSWPYSKSDIRQMSLESLRQVYREIKQENYFKALGGNKNGGRK